MQCMHDCLPSFIIHVGGGLFNNNYARNYLTNKAGQTVDDVVNDLGNVNEQIN